MNAVFAEASTIQDRADAQQDDIAVVLFGTGVVGGAWLRLLNTPAGARLRLVGAANSRWQTTDPARLADRRVRDNLDRGGDCRDDAALLAALDASDASIKVIIDATASDVLAAAHAEWLARGYHVVTANKAAAGGALEGWNALADGRERGRTCYGDAATVGAGLPVISTVRRLRACGDELLNLEGVFSGSLSWLFSRYDGTAPFSELLRHARELGYSEPDPRADLSGQDVARKLLILARSAGFDLEPGDIEVENLVPETLRGLSVEEFLQHADALDAVFAERYVTAASRGQRLRYLAQLDRDGAARVGLRAVSEEHPANGLRGTDNLFAFTTARYRAQPLVIQGPGAGAEVTAQALLGDVLALS
ncbi:homoserine dehydrogenase [Oleiagrimonas soli]|uniref:Homoserine dehydrogenase n=1 Tax=Oleiagrimonas soli TaxID=1543381 RepID=A0A099CY92_9GAMM|nr:homoserine dehydrogenase [Oleiagrimonas soli]KGI78542.1 homoserine dehydrogenase [Oleiagrimonas soli]MBB6184187.1 aspartokinase/homoserine dehydrogenase 1 [Oleiagrimonas soli]